MTSHRRPRMEIMPVRMPDDMRAMIYRLAVVAKVSDSEMARRLVDLGIKATLGNPSPRQVDGPGGGGAVSTESPGRDTL